MARVKVKAGRHGDGKDRNRTPKEFISLVCCLVNMKREGDDMSTSARITVDLRNKVCE